MWMQRAGCATVACSRISTTSRRTASASTPKARSGWPTRSASESCACSTADAWIARSLRASAALTRACSAEKTDGRCSSAPTQAADRRWPRGAMDASTSFASMWRGQAYLETGSHVNKEQSEDFGVKDKVAIVTGGGAAGEGIGNGRAAAILLARAGARVLVVDRELDLARGTVKMITEEGGRAAAHAADVTDEAQCRAMVEAAVAQFGRLDVLDNNVGIASTGTVVEEDPEVW